MTFVSRDAIQVRPVSGSFARFASRHAPAVSQRARVLVSLLAQRLLGDGRAVEALTLAGTVAARVAPTLVDGVATLARKQTRMILWDSGIRRRLQDPFNGGRK